MPTKSTAIYSTLHFPHKYDLDLIHCSVWEATQEKTKHFHIGCNKTNMKHYEWISYANYTVCCNSLGFTKLHSTNRSGRN